MPVRRWWVKRSSEPIGTDLPTMRKTDSGYSIYNDVFEPAEMANALEALATAEVARKKAGARHILAVPAV